MREDSGFRSRVIRILLQIPYGKVVTYGTVATLAGSPRAARIVGGILHTSAEKLELPWQRVVNRDGYLSIRVGFLEAKSIQKAMLESEGIEVSKDFMVNLERYGWWGVEVA